MTHQELKSVLEDHKLWLESKGEKGKRADLISAVLTDTPKKK